MNTPAGRRRWAGLSRVDVNVLVQGISLRPVVPALVLPGPLPLRGDGSKPGPRTWEVEEGVGPRRTSQDGPWPSRRVEIKHEPEAESRVY